MKGLLLVFSGIKNNFKQLFPVMCAMVLTIAYSFSIMAFMFKIMMTKASLCEAKETKKKLKIAGYFRHDYISLQLLSGWFFATVSFGLCAALWAFCNMEYSEKTPAVLSPAHSRIPAPPESITHT